MDKEIAAKPLTRGQRVIAFIEQYLKVPEGEYVGKPMLLESFQKQFILAVYDNKGKTRRAYLSIARKNGKSGLIAGILLAHIVGPEAKLNTQIVSGAMSREQAALVFSLACKIIRLSPEIIPLVRIVPSGKKIIGLARNVEYRALAADGRTAHGLSPSLAILDEVGQVRGSQSDFIDAIITSQGAHSEPLLIAISTQAPNDNDLFSIWLDDAKASSDKRIVCHLYEAPKDCDLMDKKSWKSSNPALGAFRSVGDLQEQAERAMRMPSFEPTFRNLMLNQRVEMISPFISRGIWLLNSQDPDESAFYDGEVMAGIDLSGRNDLTCMVILGQKDGKYHVKPYFWTPKKGLKDRSRRDRSPYDLWVDQGFMRTTPGASVDYSFVAREISEILSDCTVKKVNFDRWRFDLLKKEFDNIGFDIPLEPFGQGFKDMAPAVDQLETLLLNEQVAHGGHPVLTMCMANARIERDAAGNRKLNKAKATGRIDGAVALAMAVAATMSNSDEDDGIDGFLSSPLVTKHG